MSLGFTVPPALLGDLLQKDSLTAQSCFSPRSSPGTYSHSTHSTALAVAYRNDLFVCSETQVIHLLGLYPIGSCIPPAQRSQPMTVFITITAVVIVSNTNVGFIRLHGFLVTFLL